MSISNRLVVYTSVLCAAGNSIPFGDEVDKVKGITTVLEWPVMARSSYGRAARSLRDAMNNGHGQDRLTRAEIVSWAERGRLCPDGSNIDLFPNRKSIIYPDSKVANCAFNFRMPEL